MKPPLSFDQKYLMMADLGDLSIALVRPCLWEIRHRGVYLLEKGETLLVHSHATNPYGLIERHWQALTEGAPIIVSTRGGERHHFWSGYRFVEIDLGQSRSAA